MTAPGMRRAVARRAVALFVVIPTALLAQRRDAPVAAVGTAEIAGIVMSAEATPRPMPRAVVTITGGILNPRSVLTDDAGRFAFSRLPAGTYSVSARKAAYIAAAYGARKPGRAGMPVALGDGERANISISMFRGAAITGTLRDASGAPVGGVDVRVIDARTLFTLSDSSPFELATTDDRGVFRIFGLLPGDYFVVALPQPIGRGEIVSPSSSQIDAALTMLAGRKSLTTAAPHAGPQRLSPVGFSPVFYPGTPNPTEAARVHVDTGEERAGVNFELRAVPVTTIEGVVSGDVPDLTKVQVTLIPSGPRVATGMSSNSLSGRPIDAQGRFGYSNLPPGRYRLVARASRGENQPSSVPTIVNGVAIGRGGGAPTAVVTTGTSTDYLFGFADVEVRGEDVVNVSLALQPGGVISGRIVFSGTGIAQKPDDLSKFRATVTLEGGTGMVNANGISMGNGLLSNPPSNINADGTFEIRSIGPGQFTFAVNPPSGTGAGPWKLRSALAGGRSLLDDVLELGPGTDLRDVMVTFSDAPTEISGSLQKESGEVITDYYIVAMPADRSLWRPKSRRIHAVRPSTQGRFVFADVPAGEYLIAALIDLDPIDLSDPSFLEQIVPAAVKVRIAEGERKVQDLRIR